MEKLIEQIDSALKLARRMLESYRENPVEAEKVNKIIANLSQLRAEVSPESDLNSIEHRIRNQIVELERLYYSED